MRCFSVKHCLVGTAAFRPQWLATSSSVPLRLFPQIQHQHRLATAASSSPKQPAPGPAGAAAGITEAAGRVKGMLKRVVASPLYQRWSPRVFSYSMVAAASVPLAASMAFEYLRGPKQFSRKVDRSSLRFPDPFPEVRHAHIAVNGIKLHVVTSALNTGRRPLVLLLHGFPEFWYSWRHQMSALQATHDIAALDMRGYNTSDKPQGVEAYSLPTLAEDVVGVARAMGRERVILVGHDWGGMVAWAVAALHPEVVEKLAVLAAPPVAAVWNNMRGAQILRSAYAFSFQVPRLPEAQVTHDDFAILDQLFGPSPPHGRGPGVVRERAITPDEVEMYKAAMGQPGAPTAALNYYRAAFQMLMHQRDSPVCRKLLEAPIEVSTMLLWADRDLALGPELLEGVEKLVPHLRLHTLHNCSHWMQQDQPEVVTQYLKSFLEEGGSAPASTASSTAPSTATSTASSSATSTAASTGSTPKQA